jgi:hypothetical protein
MRAFAWVLLLCSACLAQEVTVRVVNDADGRPLPGWKVEVYFVNPKQGKDAVQGPHHLETDADGTAQFTLPQPVPEVLDVFAFPQAEKWYPGRAKVETAVVMQKGTQSKGLNTPSDARGKPGQILILTERVTLWDKIIHKLLGPLERG